VTDISYGEDMVMVGLSLVFLEGKDSFEEVEERVEF